MNELGLFKLEISHQLQGDRLVLDPQLLELLKDEISPDSPLIIELIAADGSVSFGIAWEFTAKTGTCQVSQEKALMLTGKTGQHHVNGQHLECKLRNVVLEKGTFAQLTFLSTIEYTLDYRALLEATLRQKYATLALDETISIHVEKENAKQEIRLMVTKLEPKNAVLTINTDIEVDIVSPVGVGLDRVISQNARIKLNWNNDSLEWINSKIDHPIHIEVI